MNCWLFQPSFWGALDRQWRDFVAARREQPKAEFYLPAAVSAEIEAGRATVRVKPTTARWFGVTYREDKPRVQAMLGELIAEGIYPSPLF